MKQNCQECKNKQLNAVYPGLLSRHITTEFMQTVLNTQMEC